MKTWSCEWLFWLGWLMCTAIAVPKAIAEWNDPGSPILIASMVLFGLLIRFLGWVGFFDSVEDDDCGIKKEGQGRGED